MLRARIKNSIRSFQKVGGTPPFSFGNALEFDGVDDYVSFNQLNFTGDFTINFWFTSSTSGSENYGLFGQPNGATDQSIWFRPNSFFRVRIGTGLYNLSTSFSSNTWYFMTVTRSGSNVTAYRDGISLGAQVVNSDTIIFNSFGVGEQVAANAPRFLNGKMDEISIYNNIVFSLSDHQNLYNLGNGEYANNIVPNPDYYFRLNQNGTDTTAIDSSGNGNDGTLNNFPASGMWVAH